MSAWTRLTPVSTPTDTAYLFFHRSFNGERGNDSRTEMRHQLLELLSANGQAAPEELLDLNRRPFHPDVNLSLSHCRDAGLIGWVSKPLKIGVDVEQLARIESHLVRRVSTREEMDISPRFELLWSSKEAAFKSRSDAIEVISSVEVFDWQGLGDDTWSFKTRLAHDKTTTLGTGEIRLIQGHTVAFFLADH